MRILCSGMVAGDPHQGGATWAVLQYVAGLASLGHEVVLVEPVSRRSDLDLRGKVVSYFRSLPFLAGRAALLAVDSDETVGLSFSELRKFAAGADLLLNVSGMLRDERLLEPIPTRAFLDLDPGFNQVWYMTGHDVGLDLHTHWVTVGQCVGRGECPIPDCGCHWIATVPPVALDRWQPADEIARRDAFTTVGHWRSYGSLEYGGVQYGQRAHSLRELIGLPRVSGAGFRLALGIHPDELRDLDALRLNGWELVDPVAVAGTPQRYAEFIAASKAELSVAKSGYVASRSGWFSDRSACYLASARPVVAQETGFSAFLPTGEGLLTYTTTAEAAEAVGRVEADLASHSRAARALAEEHLDARVVLPRLLDALSATAVSPIPPPAATFKG